MVVVPQEIEARVIELALEKAKGERRSLADLRAGQKLADVFANYGIL